MTKVLLIERTAFWFLFGGLMFLTIHSYAPIPVAPYLSISRSSSNTVTITVISGSAYNCALQMSTNTAKSPWVNIRTNYSTASPVIFTNIPATNAHTFFRMVSPPWICAYYRWPCVVISRGLSSDMLRSSSQRQLIADCFYLWLSIQEVG